MSAWTNDELDKAGSAEELQLASLRGDGTLRRPVTVWVVRHGDGLYVRSVRGPTSKWFRGVQERHEGRISAGVQSSKSPSSWTRSATIRCWAGRR